MADTSFVQALKLDKLGLMALLAAGVVEAFDAFDDGRPFGRWRVGASVHDLVNTLVWPTVLALLARYTRLLK